VPPCTLHEPPADIVLTRLVAPDPNAGADLRDAALDLVAELFPVGRPIAADAWLDTWSPEDPHFPRDERPSRPAWHLRERRPPAFVSVSSRAGLTPVVRTAEDLTLDALRDWLADVVAEPAGADGAFTLLAGFACHCLRARLDDTWTGRSTFPLLDGPRMLELPLEQRSDGPWVAGPIDDLRVPAPMEYQLDFGAGGLRLAIHSRWSWWSEPGRPEHAALGGALGRLVARGWTPSEVPDAFRPAVAGPP